MKNVDNTHAVPMSKIESELWILLIERKTK
jgi:hypothetical protein